MTVDFAAARDIMVDSQVRTNDVPDMSIQRAMRRTAREGVIPPERSYLAYADTEVEYAPGRFLMRPRDAAKTLYALRPKAGERALAIAAPYLAAVLEEMGLDVTRFDADDLSRPPPGAFDIVVSEGAVSEAPEAWLGAVAEGGRLAVTVRRGPLSTLRLYVRSGETVGHRDVFDAAPPVLPGFEPVARFAF